MTNNVKSCKQINGRVQTIRFSVFTMGRRELCGENAQKTQQIEKLKRKSGLQKLLQPCSRAARKWRENEEMKRKWRENEEIQRKWRENEEMDRE